MRNDRIRNTLIGTLLTAAVVSGCTAGKGNQDPEGGDPVTLKVLYFDERSFYDEYGMLYYAKHPNVEFDVVSTQSLYRSPESGKDYNQAMNDLIDQQNPDILILGQDQYTKFADEGKLLELETRVAEKEYNQDGLMPGLLDYIRELSFGKLYGLVPNFYGQVLYYNKDLFTQFGVTLPKDKMSWDDVLRLAAMFPTTGAPEDRIYGLKMGYMGGTLYDLATGIGMAQNLNFVNPNTKQVTINTDAWTKVFETALNAWHSGSLYTEDAKSPMTATYEDYLLQDPFIAGKVAMAIDGPYMMNQIRDAQNNVPDRAIKNWDIVTTPVDPANPDVSANVSYSQIFAVNAQSAHAEEAWSFVQYITSDEHARVMSKRQNGSLTVRPAYLKDKQGHHMEAFHLLRPVVNAQYSNYDKLPESFLSSFSGLGLQELQPVVDGQRDLKEALDSLQTKAQANLMQALEQQK